ncbi:MAG: hypothetical protein R3C18_23845 [Planctomycetaceae bacterium]
MNLQFEATRRMGSAVVLTVFLSTFPTFAETQLAMDGNVPATSETVSEDQSPDATTRLQEIQTHIGQLNGEPDEAVRNAAADKLRDDIKGCRQQLSVQHSELLAQWKTFPSFIAPEEEALRAERWKVEARLLKVKLALAQTPFWEAQTHFTDDKSRKQLLQQSADELEKIHQAHRSQVAGLYARLLQGKCFEEMGDVRIALGIYEELLGHEGQSPTMQNLHDRALHYRLVCLNREARRDYKLVQIEAEKWLKTAEARSGSAAGLGIRWELCRALESLGSNRTIEEAERTAYLESAVEYAEALNHESDSYKAATSSMIDRIQQKLDGKQPDVKDAIST